MKPTPDNTKAAETDSERRARLKALYAYIDREQKEVKLADTGR